MTFKQIASTSHIVLLSLLTTSLHAGEIMSFTWSSGVASVGAVVISPPSAPGNDDVVGDSPNEIIVTQKHYTGIGPVDIEFDVVTRTPPGGTTEYLIREGVDNSTPFDWSAYRLELGFGVGASFVQSLPDDGLDFDAPDFNSPPDFSAFFSSIDVWTEDVIQMSGGLHPNGGGFPTPLYTFSIDVPDGIDSFTLRQQPIVVPEPASVALLTLFFGALTGRQRRIV